MSGSESDTLVLIVETHAKSWDNLVAAASARHHALSPAQFVHQVSAFVNTYQLLSESNRLAVVAVHDDGAPVLYSDLHLITDPGGVIPSTPAAQVVNDALHGYLNDGVASTSARMPGPGCFSAAFSKALCMLSRVATQRGGGDAAGARILVLHACGDVSHQYIACMNAIFSAQRLKVIVDGVAVAERTSSFIQQATHMTGGLYLRPKHLNVLLQYLCTAFSATRSSREFLCLPASQGIDFKATCFCHSRVISIGYVCSVCLSVFCSAQPACLTCGTEFPTKGRPDPGTAG